MKVIAFLRVHLMGPVSIACLLSLCQCQPATDDLTLGEKQQFLEQFRRLDNRDSLHSKTSIKHARVSIKLEPHGSIRAKVYVNELPQYEYVLDREKPQNFLTKSIANANVYIIKNEKIEEGLVIDDIVAKRRYVLYTCLSPRVARTKYRDRTVFIKGYAGGLNTPDAIQELWYVTNKNGSGNQ